MGPGITMFLICRRVFPFFAVLYTVCTFALTLQFSVPACPVLAVPTFLVFRFRLLPHPLQIARPVLGAEGVGPTVLGEQDFLNDNEAVRGLYPRAATSVLAAVDQGEHGGWRKNEKWTGPTPMVPTRSRVLPSLAGKNSRLRIASMYLRRSSGAWNAGSLR